jgi:hypothetical protein
MVGLLLLHQRKSKNKPISTTTSSSNSVTSTRRRLSWVALLMTAMAIGILLTWTCTMRWIAASATVASSSSTITTTTMTKTNEALLYQSNNGGGARGGGLPQKSSIISSANATASPLDKIKVPLPIYIPSLPKSGTTSLHRYFICGQIWTAHTFVNTQDLKQLRVGECIQNNVAIMSNSNNTMAATAAVTPLDNCGTYKVFGDDGFIRGNRCYYPSLHGALPFFERAYAQDNRNGKGSKGFTLLYIRRSSESWIKSMRNWKDGNLLRKWKVCDAPFPQNNKNATNAEWMAFYEYHAQSMRQFARDHADTVTFIEVDLEDENIAQILQDKIGIDASCWGHHNSHEKRLRLNPKFRAKAAAATALAVQ